MFYHFSLASYIFIYDTYDVGGPRGQSCPEVEVAGVIRTSLKNHGKLGDVWWFSGVFLVISW